MTGPVDRLQRPLRDLRISVTDRCNFRCVYCMPKEVFGHDFHFLDHDLLLSFEEISRAARIFAGLGVRKIRITGGEPLIRREVERLIAMLAGVEGIDDLTLTTNGAVLAKKLPLLVEAGLQRVTVSLDSLDDAIFRRMNDVDFPVGQVLDAIEQARAAGLSPIKVNCVVRRGLNDHAIVDMARYFHGSGITLRFIEFMDVGQTNGWKIDDVVSAAEILRRIDAELPLEPVERGYRGEVAQRYRYRDGGGEIGIISSVTQPFCGDCTRIRLSSEGKMYTCLFGSDGFDLRQLLRGGETDAAIASTIAAIWTSRGDRYSELRTAETSALPRVEMSHIGG